MWYLKIRTFITSLLRNEGGANAFKYALIMALSAVFVISITSGLIIGGLILMSTQIGNLFNAMGECLGKGTQNPGFRYPPAQPHIRLNVR